MKRFSLPAAILALALPSAGAGESINLSSSDFIARIDETLRDPLASDGFEAAAFHAGVEAAAEAEPVRAGEVEVHFGARPGAGRGAMDVGPGRDFEAGGSDAPRPSGRSRRGCASTPPAPAPKPRQGRR